jgi:hypothetical protein
MSPHESIFAAHGYRNYIVPDFIDGEYGEGDGAQPQIGVADGSAVVKLVVVPGHGLIHDAVDGIGKAVVRQEEVTEDLGAEALGTGGRRV